MGSGQGLGGCHACIKYLMFAFNFIFWLVGCAIVGVGIWVLVDDGFSKLSDEETFYFLRYAGITLVVVGSVIMIVGFFGCCGAIRESQCLLVMFFICMLLLFLALVAAGVICLVFEEEATRLVTKEFKEEIEDKENPGELVHLIQTWFKCCGAEGPLDYALTKIPSSCKEKDGVVPYTIGCEEKVKSDLKSNVALAAGVTLGAGAVMLIGMVFSMLLCCAIRDSEYD